MQILKRLALGIPTLILISSIVFFLSKLMPGSTGAYLLEDNMQIGMQQTSPEARERVYREYLSRTGQDKPLFYFSISSLSEPDTLYKIFPESKKSFLQRLCLNFGNWPFIVDYYRALVEFTSHVQDERTINSEKKAKILSTLTLLYSAANQEDIARLVEHLEAIIAVDQMNEGQKGLS